MIDKVYLDSSFVIALQVTDHPFHIQALKQLSSLRESQLFISLFVIDEVIYVLKKYKLEKKKIVELLKENISVLANLNVIGYAGEKEIIEEYLYFWKKSKLQPTDTMHVFLMKKENIRHIATFDQDFADQQETLGIKPL
jgi:predicted nucleic acid-binding protein